MIQFRSIYAAAVSAWWCCRECDQAYAYCPGCGKPIGAIDCPENHPPALPFHTTGVCPDPACRVALAITVCGYRPNPTGDAPANRSPLSDPLPVAERPRLPTPPPPPRPAGPRLERHSYQPCPADAPRRRLAEWVALGLLPEGVPPATIAAAYRRVFGGAEPRHDPERLATRCYSVREVRGCLWLLRQEGREVAR